MNDGAAIVGMVGGAKAGGANAGCANAGNAGGANAGNAGCVNVGAGTKAGGAANPGAGVTALPHSAALNPNNEVSAERKNAAWDSAIARWKALCASAVWRWLSAIAITQAYCTAGSIALVGGAAEVLTELTGAAVGGNDTGFSWLGLGKAEAPPTGG